MHIPPQVLLVTGGYDGNNRLDTTELLRPFSGWQEITSARLPRPMYGMRVATLDNRVFLFGEWNMSCNLYPPSLLTLARVTGGYAGDDYYPEDILELTDGDSWTEVGRMKKGRSFFGVSVIEYKLYENKCK